MKSDPSIFTMQLDSVSVVPGFAGDDGNLAAELNAAVSAQHFFQDIYFLLKLELIGCVLIVATSAAPEVAALRLDS
jgi:hypothetical protein